MMRRIPIAWTAFFVSALFSLPTFAQPAKCNLIQLENSKPGALDWQLTRVKVDKASGNFRSSLIEGYCSHQSVQAGDTLQIFVSTAPASKFKLEIFRTGYYAGRGAR